MKLVQTGAYDRLQQALVKELIRTIRREVQAADAPPEVVEELSARIAFSVASLIDDTAGLEESGEEVTPMLTFQIGDEELEYAGGNSWMHEYVHKLLPIVFSEDQAE